MPIDTGTGADFGERMVIVRVSPGSSDTSLSLQ
jgi:hypothetical protein